MSSGGYISGTSLTAEDADILCAQHVGVMVEDAYPLEPFVDAEERQERTLW